jgi:hypothetical protein
MANGFIRGSKILFIFFLHFSIVDGNRGFDKNNSLYLL